MKQKFDVTKFIEDKKIDQNDISLAMASNADLIGFYGYQESLWKSYLESLKIQYEALASKLEIDIKSEYEKQTEATVKARINTNEEIVKLRKALAVVREQEMLYSNGVRTLEQRGKMLISLGAWMRAELSNMDMSISHSPSSPRISPKDRRQVLTETLANSG